MRRYIRHHTGVVHDVDAAQFHTLLAQARSIRYDDPTVEIAREATPEEVAAMWRAQGLTWIETTDEALTPAEAAARQEPSGKASKAAVTKE